MKKNIAIVAGGNSSEYGISLKSAETIINNIDKSLFNPFKIIIKGVDWSLTRDKEEDIVIDKNDFSCIVDGEKVRFDCAFIAIHGTPGEDGKLQGYFDMLNIPYTTPGVLTSSLTFDKKTCIDFLTLYGVLAAKSVLLKHGEERDNTSILDKTGLPCFVKPNNGGSSYGISKVSNAKGLDEAINNAFEHDNEVLIEEFIDGTEISCGVLAYEGKIRALGITEIVSKNEFFDFEAKYEGLSDEITPARIPKKAEQECMQLSEFIYKKLNCSGMVRIDYILRDDNLYMIEVNITPGLTEESIYPQQARHAGFTLKELFTLVIEESL